MSGALAWATMRRPPISRSVRCAVLLSLGAPALLACGGSVVVTQPVGPSPEGSTPVDSSCSVIAEQGGGGSCDAYWFSFTGTAAQCGGSDSANLPGDLCQRYCPPDPGGSSSGSGIVCSISTDATSGNILNCNYGGFCGTGRRPEGLRSCRLPRTQDPVAQHLARSAYLEAASVDAFEHLAVELEAHGAPRGLRDRASKAAREERRHARMVGALAERAGAAVRAPRVKRPRVRDLEAIAVENAVEGCVHETFGAAVAMVQAETARAPDTREPMRRIARDEARHADLAWDVARWIEQRLDPAAQERVRRARDRAVQALLRSTNRPPHPRIVSDLGVPTAPQARRIAAALATTIWT